MTWWRCRWCGAAREHSRNPYSARWGVFDRRVAARVRWTGGARPLFWFICSSRRHRRRQRRRPRVCVSVWGDGRFCEKSADPDAGQRPRGPRASPSTSCAARPTHFSGNPMPHVVLLTSNWVVEYFNLCVRVRISVCFYRGDTLNKWHGAAAIVIFIFLISLSSRLGCLSVNNSPSN